MFLRLSVSFLLAMNVVAAASAQKADEYLVKAAFLFNFAKFVDWPTEAFRGPGEPLEICVLGQDPFGKGLDDVVAGKSIEGRPLAVRRLSEASQATGCHVLFLSSSERKSALSTLAGSKQSGMLTVGEAGNPTAGGVVITFIVEGGKVRFAVNLAVAQEEKIRLSSRLLSLATVVKK